ncbi:unnamed protein product [Candida verbasci]|uniref:pH-response regulator protein palF/RIM8 n=1 Tax=Candida verbasci TaxID=1227364 RepID=A0A9W4TUQ1_9ASCO|nr:unnamed protein product [Candida verbasci]
MRRAVSKILPAKEEEPSRLDDFYIQLDNPHKVWLPGDEVSGLIVLISKKNLPNIIITLSLIGFIKINASSHSKLRPLKHTLFDHNIKIYGSEDEDSSGLNKGEHVFPFIVKLPNKRVFTSIDFGKGSINYTLKAAVGNVSSYVVVDNIKQLQNSLVTSEKVIHLINPIDVSSLPRPKPKRLILKDPRHNKLIRTQSSTSTINTFGTFSSANSENSEDEPSIKVILEVPQRGYLRGESIPIKLSINHLKKVTDTNGIIITFVRVCRLDNGPDGVVESFRKDLQQSILPLYVDPKTFSSEINSSIRVPADAFPTISGCPLVSFQYFIEVLINLSGKPVVFDERKEKEKFVNTDKFKRSKKFLQLTTEIYIGTNRSEEINSRRSSITNYSDITPPYQEASNNLQELSEKERMQQHENSLLPSAPPDEDSPPPQETPETPRQFLEELYHEPSVPNYLTVKNDRLIIPRDNIH